MKLEDLIKIIDNRAVADQRKAGQLTFFLKGPKNVLKSLVKRQ